MQGQIVAVRLPGGIEHYGLWTGIGTVISASKRMGLVVEESIYEFSGGNPIVGKGYPSRLPPFAVISKARQLIGQKWDLVFNNCQHFATQCHNVKHSPQLQLGIFALLALVVVVCLRVK